MKLAILFASLLSTFPLPAGCAGGGTQGDGFNPNDPSLLRIMPLGDSITRGSSHNVSYRALLEKDLSPRLPFTFVGSRTTDSGRMRRKNHEGHAGWAIIDFLGRMTRSAPDGVPPVDTYLKEARPQVILLMVGINDRNAPTATFEELYSSLLNRIYADVPNAKIVWSKVTPTTRAEDAKYREYRNKAIDTVATRLISEGKPVVVVDPGVGFDAATMTEDGIHPTLAGHRLIADKFLEGLVKLGVLPKAQ